MKIKDVKYESECWGGCETCDYGSSYISNILIQFENGEELKIETDQMYDYMVTEADYMQVLGNSQTINEIIISLLNIISKKSYDIKDRIFLEGMKIKINNKRIDILRTFKQENIVFEKEED